LGTKKVIVIYGQPQDTSKKTPHNPQNKQIPLNYTKNIKKLDKWPQKLKSLTPPLQQPFVHNYNKDIDKNLFRFYIAFLSILSFGFSFGQFADQRQQSVEFLEL
jgi:hypothetical protein